MLIKKLIFSGIVKDTVFMGAQAGQNRGTGVSEAENGGINRSALFRFPVVKGNDFPVGRPADFALTAFSGKTQDRPGCEFTSGQAKEFPGIIPEGDGRKTGGVPGLKKDTGN